MNFNWSSICQYVFGGLIGIGVAVGNVDVL